MRILLVDDDESIRQSLSKFVTQLGHNVLLSENGERALGVLEREEVHLVLSDIRMPVMDGHEMLASIKKSEKFIDLIVVLFTGHGDIKGAVDAMRQGAYDYLLKPINVKELAIVINRINDYLALKEENKKLTSNFEEQLDKETNAIKTELLELRKAYARDVGIGEIGVYSEKMKSIYQTLKKFHVNPDIPVLIEGETGTGKEIIARYIHYESGNITTPFVGLNCAAISATLFESELFGYEAGAFTGGRPKGQKGKLELASGGSILLDEICEIPTEYQAKLLRVLQEREYYPVGSLKKQSTDARFICATNKDVNKQVEDGTFREDLFYRLSVGHIVVPPLRERNNEVIPLAKMFLSQLAANKRTSFSGFSKEAEKLLTDFHWPGNVRQLKSTIERISLLWDDEEIQPSHLEFLFGKGIPSTESVSDENLVAEKEISMPSEKFDLNDWTFDIIRKALTKNNNNKSKTAKYLGISRNELYTYIKKIDIIDK
ncbi:MAG: sigma-54-dependent Fis family transcriptional regulator [bacterium]|nr:sigma-54-dependent Fis family transcriptional regulator [bacterium]